MMKFYCIRMTKSLVIFVKYFIFTCSYLLKTPWGDIFFGPGQLPDIIYQIDFCIFLQDVLSESVCLIAMDLWLHVHSDRKTVIYQVDVENNM